MLTVGPTIGGVSACLEPDLDESPDLCYFVTLYFFFFLFNEIDFLINFHFYYFAVEGQYLNIYTEIYNQIPLFLN